MLGGSKRGRPVNVERNPITGVLDGETANLIRSLVPTVVDETLKVLQEVTQERKNRKRFLIAEPPVFSGGLDPVVVRNWIMEMENTFEICMCSDDRKVLYASFMLKGQALFWWNEKKECLGKEVTETMTWDEFKKMVYDEYSPSTLMARLEQEYTFLKQETMTVQEYATKFIEKVRFAPDNVTTTLKINRFCSGIAYIYMYTVQEFFSHKEVKIASLTIRSEEYGVKN
nr:zinc finger, CCHC-type, retrotransposon Gag domain protein [Tanacetum cinerariifolium]